MAKSREDTNKLIDEALESILLNQAYKPLQIEEISSEMASIADKINRLNECIRQLNECTIDLSKGNLNIDLPPRSNYLACGVKQLHSHLNHLTWQTQQIAKGDYKQTVDFMGDFAVAFNLMTNQLKVREARLNAQNKILYKIFDQIECLFVLNIDNRQEAFYINKSARETFDLQETLNISDATQHTTFLNELIHLDIDENLRQELPDPDTNQWYSILTSTMLWKDDRPALLLYCTDVTLQKQREKILKKDARTDPLTGLYNRRAFDAYIQRDWQLAGRRQETISILVVDIDFFKTYNDTYGHIQGDVCLKAVAACMKTTFPRSTDLVARFGGEEFIVVLPNTDCQEAVKLAEKLRLAVQALDSPVYDKSSDLTSELTQVTVSIGVASMIPSTDTLPTQLLRMADDALYQSKKLGRNRVSQAVDKDINPSPN